MPVEVILTGVLLLLVGGWFVARFIAGDPIENWKRSVERSQDEPADDA